MVRLAIGFDVLERRLAPVGDRIPVVPVEVVAFGHTPRVST